MAKFSETENTTSKSSRKPKSVRSRKLKIQGRCSTLSGEGKPVMGQVDRSTPIDLSMWVGRAFVAVHFRSLLLRSGYGRFRFLNHDTTFSSHPFVLTQRRTSCGRVGRALGRLITCRPIRQGRRCKARAWWYLRPTDVPILVVCLWHNIGSLGHFLQLCKADCVFYGTIEMNLQHTRKSQRKGRNVGRLVEPRTHRSG